MEALRFNTAIARHHRAEQPPDRRRVAAGGAPREVAEPLVLMLAPLAPHIAEELWSRLGHARVAGLGDLPGGRPDAWLVDDDDRDRRCRSTARSRATTVPADADKASTEALVLADAQVVRMLADVDVLRVIVVPGRLVNIVTG